MESQCRKFSKKTYVYLVYLYNFIILGMFVNLSWTSSLDRSLPLDLCLLWDNLLKEDMLLLAVVIAYSWWKYSTPLFQHTLKVNPTKRRKRKEKPNKNSSAASAHRNISTRHQLKMIKRERYFSFYCKLLHLLYGSLDNF